MRKKLLFPALIFLIVSVLIPCGTFAKLGVGVGTGKITFDKPLRMGGIYTFPPLNVINTGDEPAEYGVGIDFEENKSTRSPSKEWFVFTPQSFHLEPGQSQVVNVQVSIPIKTTPGDYFAYLEGHPNKNDQSAGGVTIGISAASKMYFTIAPANIFQGIYYRIASIIKNNSPWSYVILAIVLMSVLTVLFRKYFSFNIGISRKSDAKLSNDKK